MPVTLRRCLYCGGAPVESARPRERHLVCPDCAGIMSELHQGSILVDECGACGGTWYDRGELERALEAHRSRSQALWDHLPGSPRQEESRPPKYRACPLCRQAMLRKLKRGVVIDVCTAHGAFLDLGELEQMAAYVAPAPEPERKARERRGRTGDNDASDTVAAVADGAEIVALLAALIFD